MKKTVKKLSLNRETLHRLTEEELTQPQGGNWPATDPRYTRAAGTCTCTTPTGSC